MTSRRARASLAGRALFVVAAGTALGAAFAACGGSGTVGFSARPSDAGADGKGAPDDPGLFTDADVDAASPASGNGCSADLRSVLDESGKVKETCPPDQGCGGGRCIPACDAAAMSKGNMGCDFLVSTPSFYSGSLPPCFAVFLANGWSKPAKITVSRAGVSYDVTTGFARVASTGGESTWPTVTTSGLPDGKVAVLFLSHDPQSKNGTPLTCPVPPALSGSYGSAVPNTGAAATGRGTAWSIKTDLPVSAYDIHPYGGAPSYLPSSELLLPTTAWGQNFVGVVPPKGTSTQAEWAQIIARADGTTVKIVPTQALPAGTGVSAAPANQVTTYTLAAGEFLQWQPVEEISGSVISADKPISFVGGHTYLCLKSATSSGGGCDSGHQLVPPVAALGREYVGPNFATRMASNAAESIPYRIVGTVAGTTLTYDPPVAGAPSALTVGQVVDFESAAPFVVRSQDAAHPFYLAQLMPGCNVTGGGKGGCIGDEEFVNVLPPAQYLSRYVFFTDPTYPTTNLVLVRKKTAAGAKDVTVDCLGAVTDWKPIGSGPYEIATPDLVRGGAGVKGCANGPHTAESEAPFGLVVWGLASAASYAYPGGGNVGTINDVVVPPIPR